jgi:hypothetical protein
MVDSIGSTSKNTTLEFGQVRIVPRPVTPIQFLSFLVSSESLVNPWSWVGAPRFGASNLGRTTAIYLLGHKGIAWPFEGCKVPAKGTL